MHFFTSLIVLVPLVFSVVALPASTQEASAITSGINAIVVQLATDAKGFTTNTNAAQAQVVDALTQFGPLLTQLETDAKDYPSSSFGQADANAIFNSAYELVPPLIQFGEALVGAAPELLQPGPADVAKAVTAFVVTFEGAGSAILERFPSNWAIQGSILRTAIGDELNSIGAAYGVASSAHL